MKAALDLKQHLSRLLNHFPKAEHFIVAHSHGGNVAMRALQDWESEARGDKEALSDSGPTGPAVHRIKVATLGTPFLSVVKRPFPVHVALFATLMFAVVLMFGTQLFLSGEWRGNLRYQLLLLLWAVMAMNVFLAALILGWSRLAFRRTATALRLQVEEEAARVSSPTIAPDRLFVVRAQGDEAAGLLGAAQLSAWVLESLLSNRKLLRRLFFTIVALSAAVGIVLVLVGGGGFDKVDSAMGWGFYMVSAAVIAAGTILVLTNLPFGTDMLHCALFASVTAGASPMGHGGKSYQAGRADVGGLSHKVYDDPGVIEAVVEWVKGEESVSDACSDRASSPGSQSRLF